MIQKSTAEQSLLEILQFSDVITDITSNANHFITRLNNISQEGKNHLSSIYKNAEGPVKTIRREVANLLLERTITISDIQEIIDRRVEENPSSYKSMYKSWFNFLYMFILCDDKDRLNEAIENVKKFILQELGADLLKAVQFDFTGERETGSRKAWIAFFNTTHPNQKTAKQLFISVEDGIVFYSIYDRPKSIHENEHTKTIADNNILDGIVEMFKRTYSVILDDEYTIPQPHIFDLDTNYQIYKASIGPKEINNDAFDYFLNENLLVVHGETPAMGISYDSQGYRFTDILKIGDYFYLTRGNEKIWRFGRITSEAVACFYGDLGDNGWMQRSYEVLYDSIVDHKYRGQKKWWTPNNNSTFVAIPVHEIALANRLLFEPFFNLNIHVVNNEQISFMESRIDVLEPLNTILYGPPGTGKTYSTIDKVVQICSPGDYKSDHVSNKVIYDELVRNGRVVFTTFHQSIGYEEFIEGIKPVPPVNKKESIQYEVRDGVFKSICEQCFDEILEIKSSQNQVHNNSLSFEAKYGLFVDSVKEGRREVKTKTDITATVSKISKNGNMRLRTSDVTRDYIVSKNRLEKLFKAYPDPEEIKNVQDDIRKVIGGSHSSLYYAALVAFVKFDQQLSQELMEAGTEISLEDIRLTASEINTLPKYVLVIDEINRGNVSAIFGELITLIEEDKRFGRINQLFADLPYSQNKFIVPPNLYIIGTMNTADRSVESLDTALRRRFSFVEMLPQPELIRTHGKSGGFVKLSVPGDTEEKDTVSIDFTVDLVDLLKTINARIEVLVDRDHTIGHAYLMDVDGFESLKHTFQNKIIPLLQEYFYGDYRKLEMVIGSDFFEKRKKSLVRFAEDYDLYDRDEEVYKIRDVSQFSPKEMMDALIRMM